MYSSTIADLQTSSNATSYACDPNAQTNSTISTRLDQLAERYKQFDQRTSNNRNNLLSLCTLIDQLLATSETQLLSLTDQLQVLSDSAHSVHPTPIPTPSVEIVEVEHTGDIADVGVFSDNADKTIFEFLE